MDAVERYGIMLVLVIVLVASPLLDSYMRAIISVIIEAFARIFGVA